MNKLKVKLSGVEYLLVCIQSNPGRSQRYYLRRLHIYKHGRADPNSGGTCSGYFTSKSYRDILWRDIAPKNSRGKCWLGYNRKPSCSQMVLTDSGRRRADTTRLKLGLPPGAVLRVVHPARD